MTAHVKPGVHLPDDEPTTRTCLLETAGIFLRAHARHSPRIGQLGGCVILPFLNPKNRFLLKIAGTCRRFRSSFGHSSANLLLYVLALRGTLVAQAQGLIPGMAFGDCSLLGSRGLAEVVEAMDKLG